MERQHDQDAPSEARQEGWAVEINGLYKWFGDFQVLADVNCSASLWQIMPAEEKSPMTTPWTNSSRVHRKVPERTDCQTASNSAARTKRGISTIEAMNQVLLCGSRRSWRNARPFTSGKLTPQKAVARIRRSIARIRKDMERIKMAMKTRRHGSASGGTRRRNHHTA